ncbi:MAG: SET domain-containing protein-lysine N-methyltransferase [Flavipsychrobacter sp.]|nr:SET domain-containing protein-lysine N-methyltransferase [Flavipsychrobacter sp.]
MIYHAIYIDTTNNKGRGVFTSQPIIADEVIEISPVIVMSAEERNLLDQTTLHDYIFEWTPDGNIQCCMAQGYISVYNHSYASNCEYFMNYEDNTIMIKTVRDIIAGEELTINYNGDWNDEKPVWFDVKD